MKKWLIGLMLSSALSLQAVEMTIDVEISPINVQGRYHNPYIAGWIEDKNKKLLHHLFVWYQDALDSNEGEEWLNKLRTWWRKGGRKAYLPIDGVSGATKRIGTYQIVFDSNSYLMRALKPGKYIIYIEATREAGGKELLKLPFDFSIEQELRVTAKGNSELGEINLQILP